MKSKMKKTMIPVLVATLTLSVAVGLGSVTALADGEDECTHVYVNGFCTVTSEETHYEAATLHEGATPEEDYYEIANAGQLYWFAQYIDTSVDEEGEATFPNAAANAKLTADIVVNEGVITGNVNEITVDEEETLAQNHRTWKAIGEECQYMGTFDGDGHTVSGIYFQKSAKKQGLFGSLGGTVKNLGVKDSYLRLNNPSGSTNERLGAIAGFASEGARIENCFSENNYIRSGYNAVGGIVGMVSNNVTVVDCWNSSKVMAYQRFGGIVGEVRGSAVIERCYNLGKIEPHDKTVTVDTGDENNVNSGGLAGYVWLAQENACVKITNGYNAGAMALPENVYRNYIGGLVGQVVIAASATFTMQNCFNVANFPTGDGGELQGGDRYVSATVGYINATSWSNPCTNVIISEVYYPEGMGDNWRFGDETVPNAETTALSSDKYTGGELAYLLQSQQVAEGEGEIPEVWGQTLSGNEAQAYPVLGGKKVNYGYPCDAEVTEAVYTNAAVGETADERPDHTGGTATCTDCKECEVCGESYGVALGHDMGEATCTEASACQRAGCTHTEGAALGHSYDGDADATCNVCGEERTVPTPEPIPEGGLGTGAIIGIVVAAVVVAGVGGFAIFWFVIRKKTFADLMNVFKKQS